MENTNPEESEGTFEIFNTQEELEASMESTAPETEEALAPEADLSEISTENITPESVPPVLEEQLQGEQTDIPQGESVGTPEPEYTDQNVEQAVFSYLSEKLGREISSLDNLSNVQQNALDERVEVISRFIEETGRGPEDWFAYQQLNPSEMDDTTAIRVNMASEYPNLSNDELSLLMGSKYKLDPEVHTDEEVKLSQLQMKIDAQKAKQSIEGLRQSYVAPVKSSEAPVSVITDEWVSDMSKSVQGMNGLEFDLGGGKTFKFGLDDNYKSNLIERNKKLDEYFDPYVRKDGSWDFQSLSSSRAVVDNIDKIISSAYRQGMSDGQRGIVDKAANVSTSQPTSSGQTQTIDPVVAQIKNHLTGQKRDSLMSFN